MAARTVAPGAYVGVDSGGTRTNVAVCIVAPDGSAETRSYEVPESLGGALPVDLLPDTLWKILARLERMAAELEGLPVHVWISAAGFTPWTRPEFLGALEDLVPRLLDGSVRRAAAANDGVSLLLGHNADCIVIAGTGSTVIVRSDGELHQSGGHEWVACDQGSGFWIALHGIRKAYKDLESGLVDSALLNRMRKMYDAPDDRRVVEKMRYLAMTTEDTKKEIARFAGEVCDAAERGDADAQDIVKAEAEDLADLAAGALRRTFNRARLSSGVSLVQCGSILGNRFYREIFNAQLKNRLRSEDQREARLDCRQVTMGRDAAVRLAQDLSVEPSTFDRLGQDFAPAVADWT